MCGGCSNCEEGGAAGVVQVMRVAHLTAVEGVHLGSGRDSEGEAMGCEL